MGLAALTTLLVLACGFVLARFALGASRPSAPWPEALAWAPAMGFGVLSLVFFGWRLSGVPGAEPGGLAALALVSVLVLATTRGQAGVEPGGRPEPEDPRRTLPRALRWAGWLVLAVTAAGLLLAFYRWSVQWPLGTTDAINIWNVRARLLLFADGEGIAEALRLTGRGHPDYPLLLPAALAGQGGFWGAWDQALPQATGVTFLLGLGVMTYVGLGRLGAGRMAAAGTALVLASPPVWRWAFAQCADVPLAYLTLAAGVGLASQLDSSSRPPVPPVLAAFAFGLLPWVKNDGVVLAASFGASFALFWLLRKADARPGPRSLLMLAAGALPGLAAVVLFKTSWAPPGAAGLFLGDSPWAKLVDPERWTTVLSTVGATIDPLAEASPWRWIAAALLLALALLAPGGSLRRPHLAFLASSLALTAVGYVVVYVLSPYELEWHVPKSVDRLLLQLFPLVVVWAFALAGSPAEGSRRLPSTRARNASTEGPAS